ncbi:MAG TPA: peptide deformylase [Candidatus Kapabacteria bacterium]|nr:peptide deformylase [Candidatus Kapabacteria bacterium]
MAILPIVKHPTSTLRVRSKEVDKTYLALPETKKFIKNLIDTMYANDGIGIASSQVGTNVRICIIGKDAVPGKKKDLVLVNPICVKTSKKMDTDSEGCLSVPKIYGNVKRYRDLAVNALDENGNPLSFSATKFFARVIQHEIDHLDGTLYIDKATDLYAATEEDHDRFLENIKKEKDK